MNFLPGAIYRPDGNALDEPRPRLAQADLDSYPHCSLLMDRDRAPVARMRLLSGDAEFAAVPPAIVAEAVKLMLAGKGVLILAQRREPKVHVRTGLLQALDLFTATEFSGSYT